MTRAELEQMIRAAHTSERDAVEATTLAVIGAVRSAGAISLMPSSAMPITGLLMHVHPKVYDRLQKMKLEGLTGGPAAALDPK